MIPLVVLVAAASAGAGLLTREIYQRPLVDTPPLAEVSSTTPRAALPGDRTVKLTADAAEHPEHEAVRGLLQSHFDAINDRRYDAWAATVTALRAQGMPRSQWESDYASTQDGSIVVQRIESASTTSLRVLLNFVSTQDTAKAPDDLRSDCIRWRVVYLLVWDGNKLKLSNGPENRSPQYESC
ncbi:hypothetical protein LX83_002078 [Goodfellowiella coeruleoviolacea]|uniref:Uncharacterized protein n=2 Tax=Goodfellowiella coeruleoviolacea TaxID=334858 RepID=A0AAE3KG87_9PSEU|nr:hypothetical protein [Goodfellowiella coeruleoviolacea]